MAAGAEAGQDLIVAGDTSPYAVLRMEQKDITDLLHENLGGATLTERDLDRVKVPAGGGLSWEVPTAEGISTLKEIEGVIVHRGTRRAYWPDAFDGSGETPDCFSDDGEVGIGSPGGACESCVMNEWPDEGGGKPCKELRMLFVLTPDSLVPLVVAVPPASLANVRAYFLRLLRVQLSPLDVSTRIGLEKATSKSGIGYSRVTLTLGERLDPDAKARLKAYAAELEPAFKAAARTVARDEAGAL